MPSEPEKTCQPDRRRGYRDLLETVAPEKASWSEVVAPITARFFAGAMTGNNVVYNPEGSLALAELLESMARILDTEIMERKVDANVG